MFSRNKNGWIDPVVLTACLMGVLAGVSAGQRWLPAMHLPSPDPFILWLALLLLAGTTTTIFWAAIAAPAAGAISSRRFLGYALVTDFSGIMLILVGVWGGHLKLVEALRVYVVLVAWLALWTSMAVALRTVGSAFATVATLAVALCCFAAPLLVLPLDKAVTDAIPGSQRSVDELVATATPMLAVTDAVKGDRPIHWSELAGKYLQWPNESSLQHAPLPVPKWWISAIAYASVAGLLWIVRRPWRQHP